MSSADADTPMTDGAHKDSKRKNKSAYKRLDCKPLALVCVRGKGTNPDYCGVLLRQGAMGCKVVTLRKRPAKDDDGSEGGSSRMVTKRVTITGIKHKYVRVLRPGDIAPLTPAIQDLQARLIKERKSKLASKAEARAEKAAKFEYGQSVLVPKGNVWVRGMVELSTSLRVTVLTVSHGVQRDFFKHEELVDEKAAVDGIVEDALEGLDPPRMRVVSHETGPCSHLHDDQKAFKIGETVYARLPKRGDEWQRCIVQNLPSRKRVEVLPPEDIWSVSAATESKAKQQQPKYVLARKTVWHIHPHAEPTEADQHMDRKADDAVRAELSALELDFDERQRQLRLAHVMDQKIKESNPKLLRSIRTKKIRDHNGQVVKQIPREVRVEAARRDMSLVEQAKAYRERCAIENAAKIAEAHRAAQAKAQAEAATQRAAEQRARDAATPTVKKLSAAQLLMGGVGVLGASSTATKSVIDNPAQWAKVSGASLAMYGDD